MNDMYDYTPGNVVDGGSDMYEGGVQRLKVGQEINVTKKDPTLKRAIAGLGWDIRGFDANPPDLDVSVFLLDKNGQTKTDEDFIFYNNPMGGEGSVRHLGDSRTGAGDGDDEQIEINLATLPFEVIKIVFVLSLYNLDMGMEGHSFSMVKNVYFRLVNQDSTHELFRIEIDENTLTRAGSAMVFSELERIGSEWMFYARVEPIDGGLGKIASDLGVVIAEMPTG